MEEAEYDLDLVFVARIMSGEDLLNVQIAGIEEEMLFDEGRDVFGFIVRHFSKYGVVPTKQTILEKVGVELNGIEAYEPIEYYVEEVRKRYLGNTVGAGLQQAIVSLKAGNPQKALEAIGSAQAKAIKAGSGGSIVDIVAEGESRIKEYERLQKIEGFDGLPTPWPMLNDITLGWHEGELVIVVGRPGKGKSFLLAHCAKVIWEVDCGVILFVSMEMSALEIGKRWDALCAELPYFDLRRGKLDSRLEEKYRDTVAGYGEKKAVWLVDGSMVRTVADIGVLIGQLHPQIVIVDGLYMLHGLGGDSWEKVTGIVKDLNQMAITRKVPVIASTQFNRRIKDMALSGGLGHLGFSDMTGMAAQVVLALFQNEDLRRERRMLIKVLKNRNGPVRDFYLNWDLDFMNFEEIGSVEDMDAGKVEDDIVPF